ncbi:hypothetical protein [Chroococcidiopsis sp. CCNUC1]|uniref:hypothetical protein n=1 Tax=Chroococcidiopsis sp. CCNUC1 TaxID=2653189 RepID=UPI002021F462|nr:hypothetical protein [Chroococcidiopsis sp. CCNUC1]URD52700.1 hypothetical protein M5J74_12050 [Chroococcidiopsis sp. CCNUC1]
MGIRGRRETRETRMQRGKGAEGQGSKNCQPPTTHYPLPITYYPLPPFTLLLITDNWSLKQIQR